MKVVAYLTHPLGPIDKDPIKRGDNIANAIAWVRWARENTNWAINAAWITNLMAGDETLHRPRVLVDQMAQLVRCDALILVGGEVTTHMRVEYQFAKSRGMPIVDATILGRFPPPTGTRPEGKANWTNWLLARATGPIVPLVAH